MANKKNKQQTKNEESSMGQIAAKYISYWPLFIFFLVISIAGAIVLLRYTIPKYEASANLIIKDEKKGIEDNKAMEMLDIISTKKISENEVEVLQSRPIMENVVKELMLYTDLKQEGKIKELSAYVSSPVWIVAQNPDQISMGPKKDPKIKFEYKGATSQVVLNNSRKYNLNEWINTHFGVIKFIPNPRYNPERNNGKPFYFTMYPPKDVTMDVLGSLKVTPSSKLSSLLNLVYKDEVPEKAEDILNQLINYYNKAAILEKNLLVKNTIKSIEERMMVVKRDLDSIERNVQQFKASNSAVELNQQGNLYLQNVSTNDAKLNEVNVQLSVLEQAEKYVTLKDNSQAVLPSSVGLNDPSITQMMTSLNQAMMEKEKLKKTVAENSPIMVSLSDQIEKLKPNLLSSIQNQRKNLELSKNSIASTSGRYSSMLNYIPQKEKQLIEISREQNIKSSIYQFLVQKREESELSYASTLSDSKVVNYAQAGTSPVSPKSIIFYFAAILLGLGIPIILINAKELMNSKILYRKEIESATSVPVIGEIAHNKSKNPLVLEAGKRTFIAEEFRKIRISLLYLGIDAIHKKKILITSSIPGEGKSFISSNLAISLAMTGKKVVLVDLDLHNPSLGNIFKKQDSIGVSNFLNDEKTVQDILIQTHIDNLAFIPSGTLPESPSELLVNGKVQDLINQLEHIFDIVIMDTAPTVYVTDAYTLTNYADATLYVVRHNHTPKLVIKRMDENNSINPLNNQAIIFNGVKTRGFMKSNYGYGYEYVYGKKEIKKNFVGAKV